MPHRNYIVVAVHRENYARLQKLGHVPESFNGIITRVLDGHYKAGALMISGVILGVLTFFVLHDYGVMNATTSTSKMIVGAAAAAFSTGTGVVCIVGGYAIYRNPKRNKTKWGIAILIPSFIGLFILTGFFILSGFIIGPILGIVAGLLAVTRPALGDSPM